MDIENQANLAKQALAAIHNEVLKLLKQPLSPEVGEKIALIESICRHRLDVRTSNERES
jgi:hypothetical protein